MCGRNTMRTVAFNHASKVVEVRLREIGSPPRRVVVMRCRSVRERIVVLVDHRLTEPLVVVGVDRCSRVQILWSTIT
jgi:hypothetical protein